jgi:hypothetical protein
MGIQNIKENKRKQNIWINKILPY